MKSSVRETKKVAVREALERAALELIGARGFDAVTVDDIAAAAAVSRRTFFRYFRTKEEVLFSRRRAQLADLVAALAVTAPNESAVQAVRRVMLLLAADYVPERRRILREQRIVANHPALKAYDLEIDFAYETAIARALGARMRSQKAAQRKAKWIAAACVAVVRVTLQEWAESDGKADLAAMGREAFAFLERLDRS
jgi:AcrR family transcriptional regulator